MDIVVPAIPDSYSPLQRDVAAFIERHRPHLRTKERHGVRTPEHRQDVDQLRRWLRAVHDAGYQVTSWFVEHPDRDPMEARVVAEAFDAAGVPMTVGSTLVHSAVAAWGTPEQRARVLPAIWRGELIACQLFSEPDAGSDLASLRTRARRDGDHYLVNGQKVWTTWAQWADCGYLLARTNPEAPKHRGISAFILTMGQPGVTIRPLREITGTSDFSEVFFDDAAVESRDRIGDEDAGWRVATTSLTTERDMLGGGDGPTAVVDALAAIAHDRHGHLQDAHVRQQLGRLYARAAVQRSLGLRFRTRAEQGHPRPGDTPMTKLYSTELNLDLASTALDLLGPAAVLTEGDPASREDGRWQDMFLYARAYTIGGGTSEIMRNMIAERALGLPREPAPS